VAALRADDAFRFQPLGGADDAADQLARGAIELEATDAGRVTWTTLPFVRNSTVAVVDRAR